MQRADERTRRYERAASSDGRLTAGQALVVGY